MKMDKNPINFMDSANRLAGQWSEFLVLQKVWCVGNFTPAVDDGRTGWKPDLSVTTWNSDALLAGV